MTIDRILERLLRLHPKLIDLSLTRLKKLLNRLGNPEKKLPPVIHVAGTNGKGSTIATLAAIYKSAGYSVHIYTSPHLVNFTERIVISGSEISENYLEQILFECENANKGENITFFEITTAAAILAFSRHPADLLLLEVGLGGRFDATNIIKSPLLSIITPISMDHQDFLGETIGEIAFEKAGILKTSVPAIIGPQTREALNVIKNRARDFGSPISVFGEDWKITRQDNELNFEIASRSNIYTQPSLLGDHQLENTGCALAAAILLKEQFPVTEEELNMGLSNIKWPARLQKLTEGRLVDMLAEDIELWVDGGHNPGAAKAISATLKNWKVVAPKLSIHMVFGALNNRSPQDFLKYFTNIVETVRTVGIPGEKNSFSALETMAAAVDCGLNAFPARDIRTALADIVNNSNGNRIILVCGSLYLAGAVLSKNGCLKRKA